MQLRLASHFGLGIATAALAAAIVALRRRAVLRKRIACSPAPRRDLRGYGPQPPAARWPRGAKIAVNFAINLEEGSEPNMPDGDAASTAALCECPSDAPVGVRDLAAESMFEYGSRVGFWRIMKLFDALGTCVAVETEEMMKKMMPVTCLMGQFYAQQRATHQWLVRQGVDGEQAPTELLGVGCEDEVWFRIGG